jgi:hypothetical protein
VRSKGEKNPADEGMRAKLLKYKAKVAHYEVMLEKFFLFVEHRFSTDSTKYNYKADNLFQPEYGLQSQQGSGMEK